MPARLERTQAAGSISTRGSISISIQGSISISIGGAASSRTPNRISTRLTTITRAPTRFPGHRVPIRASPRSTTARNTAAPPTVLSTTAPFFSSSTPGSRPPMPGAPSTQAMPSWPTAAYATSSYLHDSTPSWTLSPFQDAAAASSSSPSSTSSTTTTPETSTSPKFQEGNKSKSTSAASNTGSSILFVIEELRFSKITMGHRRSPGTYCKSVLAPGIQHVWKEGSPFSGSCQSYFWLYHNEKKDDV